jgi:aspartyl-tRNA(Asn)/glutamyl-tRNA(Gln) amidotransferase subunit A
MEIAPRPTITELSGLYESGEVSPVQVVQEILRRIERLDPALNSFVTVTDERALERAEQAETEIRDGRKRGPLHGIPYAAKDLLDTRGILTTIGSKIMADNVPRLDAAVVEKLDQAGAILVGKTGLHEWAYGITSTNPHFGAVRNPWDPDRIPGGSSGGSASALAAGLCAFSLGSDTGGSIRIPAALCGIVGLKPTFGRISRRGAFPLGHTLDTLGPFGLCVQDTALAYAAMAGYDPRDPASSKEPVGVPSVEGACRLEGTAIGVPAKFYFEGLVPDVDNAVCAALRVLEELGAELREVEVPDIELANSLHRLILLAEATSVHRLRLGRRREDFGEDVRLLLDQGRFVLATDYLDAQRARREFCRSFETALRGIDALVAPAIPIPTARVGELEIEVDGTLENVRLATTRNIRALNLTGLPVLSVPCGFHRDGMPIGLQIVGPRYSENRILSIGHAYERATPWHAQLPPMLREPPSGTGPNEP